MKKAIAAALALTALLFSGCAANKKLNSTLFAMDTVMELEVYGANAAEGIEAAKDEILRIENLLSAERPGSDIYAVNEGSGSAVRVSGETADIISFACGISEMTGGALDISVYPAVEAWGFVSGREYRVPDKAELSALAELVDYSAIAVSDDTAAVPRGGKITLGAVAKGYAGTCAADILKEHGITSALLTLGGNVVCVGERPDGKPWKIGIASPDDPSSYFGVVECSDKSVVTSGAYQRNFEVDGKVYHHIIDPAACSPADSDVVSATVIAQDGALADALSTAVYVMGSERAIELWRQNDGFELVIMKKDGSVIATEGAEYSSSADAPTEYISR